MKKLHTQSDPSELEDILADTKFEMSSSSSSVASSVRKDMSKDRSKTSGHHTRSKRDGGTRGDKNSSITSSGSKNGRKMASTASALGTADKIEVKSSLSSTHSGLDLAFQSQQSNRGTVLGERDNNGSSHHAGLHYSEGNKMAAKDYSHHVPASRRKDHHRKDYSHQDTISSSKSSLHYSSSHEKERSRQDSGKDHSHRYSGSYKKVSPRQVSRSHRKYRPDQDHVSHKKDQSLHRVGVQEKESSHQVSSSRRKDSSLLSTGGNQRKNQEIGRQRDREDKIRKHEMDAAASSRGHMPSSETAKTSTSDELKKKRILVHEDPPDHIIGQDRMEEREEVLEGVEEGNYNNEEFYVSLYTSCIVWYSFHCCFPFTE